MTAANKITILRVGLIPFFVACELIEFPYHQWAALVIFVIAAATDYLDGYVARKYNQVTDFGKFMDPLADKLIVAAALILFVENGQMAGWACLLVIAREFAVTGLRLIAMERGVVIAAAFSGKVKTMSSCICIIIMLLPIHDFRIFPWLTVDDVCVFIILATTLYSGIEYFVKAKDLMKEDS